MFEGQYAVSDGQWEGNAREKSKIRKTRTSQSMWAGPFLETCQQILLSEIEVLIVICQKFRGNQKCNK